MEKIQKDQRLNTIGGDSDSDIGWEDFIIV